MNNLRFGPQVFLRACLKTYHHFDYIDLNTIIKEKDFQAAIYFASESLYYELEKSKFEYRLLSDKCIYSLKKYYNRYCFRPTPFGLFSGVGILNWGDQHGHPPTIISKQTYIYPDFTIVNAFGDHLLQTYPKELLFFSNPTIYRTKSQYRYLKHEINEESLSSVFKIYSFGQNPFINNLLKYCKTGKSKTAITDYFIQQGEEQAESEYYIEELIDACILLPETGPNYVGEPYFSRLNKRALGIDDAIKSSFSQLNCFFSKAYEPESIPIEKLIDIKWPFATPETKSNFYVNTALNFNSEIDKNNQNRLMEGFEVLNKLTQYKPSKALETFKKAFLKRFENQAIPLLHALDPELGIGYLNLENDAKENILLNDLDFKNADKSEMIEWSPVHQLLLNKILKNEAYREVIITDQELPALNENPSIPLPPSFSLLFNITDNYINIEHAGGISAATLPARFTLFSDELNQFNKHIVAEEIKANSDVLFAEISCITHGRTANINTRNHTYKYELPLLLTPSLNSEFQLDLNDLYVFIYNDEIVLRSKKLNKVIIPRFSSAYNYNNHDLALFRFLCDLQYQSVKTDFTLNLSTLFPGLSFYPRVKYKSCIIHRASWILDKQQLEKLNASVTFERDFKELFQKLCIPQLFNIADGDNSLIFNQSEEQHVNLFSKVIKGKNSVIIKEALISEKTIIADEQQNPLSNEMVAVILNSNTVYRNISSSAPQLNKVKRTFIPADEWLYFKIYCLADTANELIGNELHDLIKQFNKTGSIHQWFFIRYYDPEPHLRFRLKVKDGHIGDVTAKFNSILKKKVVNNAIRNIQIDTYSRELERYGDNHIATVEKISQCSSNIACHFFRQKEITDQDLLPAIIKTIDDILNHYFADMINKEKFAAYLVECMGIEFELDKKLEIQLNDKYRKLRPLFSNIADKSSRQKQKTRLLSNELHIYLNELEKELVKEPEIIRQNLYKDIIHMHVNRMLKDNHRKQEFIIYNLLQKYYHTENMKKKSRHA